MKAVIYARYSSHNQREESIEGQIRECQDFASRNNFIIVDEYIDRAISGRTDDRENFQRMIKDSEKGHFDAVIMYTLDRFARNRYDSATYKAKLKKNGVRVFYAKQTIPEGAEGIILESVLEGMAEYYSENLARNVKRGLTENALQCKTNGGKCLGYRKNSEEKFEVDPAAAKVVQEIFQMYAAGNSATQIVNHCNERGYKTVRGNPFTKNSLRTILQNKKYIGIYEYDDVVVEGGVPAILDKELFDKVQAKLKHNYSARAKAKAKEDYLLSTKLFCGHCGSNMIGESGTSRHGQTYHYYKCGNRKRGHDCQKKTEKKDWLEKLVVEYTVQKVLTKENIENIATKAIALIEKEAADNTMRIAYENEYKDVVKRISNLLNLMEQGIFTESTKERLLDLESRKKDLERNIARENAKKPRLTKERIIYWLTSFKHGDINDNEYRCRVIDTLVNSIYVYDTDGGKGRRIIFTFNISGENTSTLNVSDIEGFGVPNCANPNPFFVKHCFGFVLKIEDIG